MKKEKVFVTGATGCLGANLVVKLVKEGYEVNALVYPGTAHPYLKNLKINKFEGDVLDKNSLRKAMKGCKYVYHVAGIVSYNKKDFNKLMKVHVEGTRNILEVAKELKVKKVVYTSSSASFGMAQDKNKPLNEKDIPSKKYKSVGYILSKHLAEKEVIKFSKKGLNAVIVNPSAFYGAGDINMNQGEIVKNMAKGLLRFAFPGGNSVVATDDVVEGHLLAMKKGKSGEKYILSNENMNFLKEFNILAKILNKKKIKVVLSPAFYYILNPLAHALEKICGVFGLSSFHPEAITMVFRFRYFDSSKARKELGWVPKQSFGEAIKKAIKFYQDNNLIKIE